MATKELALESRPSWYRLTAVLTISISHYVCFLRGPKGDWFFYDSMADRLDLECVPRLLLAPDVTELMSALERSPGRPLSEIVKPRSLADRLVRDCYLCVYEPLTTAPPISTSTQEQLSVFSAAASTVRDKEHLKVTSEHHARGEMTALPASTSAQEHTNFSAAAAPAAISSARDKEYKKKSGQHPAPENDMMCIDTPWPFPDVKTMSLSSTTGAALDKHTAENQSLTQEKELASSAYQPMAVVSAPPSSSTQDKNDPAQKDKKHKKDKVEKEKSK